MKWNGRVVLEEESTAQRDLEDYYEIAAEYLYATAYEN